jgi:hypothetical protein
MRDYAEHHAQQTGEFPGGGLLALFWRSLARQMASGFSQPRRISRRPSQVMDQLESHQR